MTRNRDLPSKCGPKDLLRIAADDAVTQLKKKLIDDLYEEIMKDPSKERQTIYTGPHSAGLLLKVAERLREDGYTVERVPSKPGTDNSVIYWFVGGWTDVPKDPGHREGPYR